MRRRSTFVLSEGVDYDPTQFKIAGRHLSFTDLKAAREERLTFGLSELPSEIVELLESSHEVHIRWVADKPYERSGPYLSALTPGLHVHYTPTGKSDQYHLCILLQKLFSSTLRCSSTEASFTKPDILSERFTASASFQYYSLLPSVRQLVTWVQRHVCDPLNAICARDVALLDLVAYLDFDYDSISHALVITAFWSQSPAVLHDPESGRTTYEQWHMTLDALPNDKNEVGLLRATKAPEPSEIQMEGFLAVIGEDITPNPTMFFFPSRQHSLPSGQANSQTYSVSFDKPTGLHPTMRITFPCVSQLREPANKPEGSTCALHTYLTLPSVLFVDEYAFPTSDHDPLFTEAHNILSLRSYSGERDLEAPDYVIQKWGSALLLELAPPGRRSAPALRSTETWDVTIPLHLRYLKPVSGGKQRIEIPWPIVFWACTADEGTKFNTNPFDRVNLGYDGLFGPRTMFYHLDPRPEHNSDGRLVQQISVPVIDSDAISHGRVEMLTTMLVLGGFLWVAWKVVGSIRWEVQFWSNRKDERSEKKVQ